MSLMHYCVPGKPSKAVRMSQGWTGNPVCQGSLVEEPWEVHTDEGIDSLCNRQDSKYFGASSAFPIYMSMSHSFLSTSEIAATTGKSNKGELSDCSRGAAEVRRRYTRRRQ